MVFDGLFDGSTAAAGTMRLNGDGIDRMSLATDEGIRLDADYLTRVTEISSNNLSFTNQAIRQLGTTASGFIGPERSAVATVCPD
jgi:hypothetical protein